MADQEANTYSKLGIRRSTSRINFSSFLSAAFVFVFIVTLNDDLKHIQAQGQAHVSDSKGISDFLNKHDAERKKIPYSNLQEWYDSKQGQAAAIKPEHYPRLFPFCVTYDQVMNSTLTAESSHLYKFNQIFKIIKLRHDIDEKFYHFNKTRHSIVGNTTFIKSVKLSRINTPEKDMVNLRQWLHVRVETKSGLKGLYMQSVAGPIGLPIGEFNIDFPCSDLPNSADIDTIGELYYCHYRPRANIYHPKVYVGYVDKEEVEGVREFHVHFQWTDITCMETPYIQFLMIAVKRFVANPRSGIDYQLIFSNVFLNQEFDSLDGSPYPYYPLWRSTMLCNADANTRLPNQIDPGKRKVNGDHVFAPIKWKAADDVFRIQPNEEFDACIRGSNDTDKDEIRMECPPGPFQCTKSYDDASRNVTKDRETLIHHEKSTSHCFPCVAPKCEELNYTEAECTGIEAPVPKTIIVTKNDTNVIEKTEDVVRSKSHGMLSSLAALVFLPMANYVSRHYKEVCRNCLCGNGPWIFIHILFHVLSTCIMWVSIGPVIASISDYSETLQECQEIYPGDEEKTQDCAIEKSLHNPHVSLGILVVVLQNLLIIFGFFRSYNNKMRMCQLTSHSHLGYLTFILAGVSALVASYNNNCIEVVALLSVLFLLPIVFFAIGCCVDILTDKKVGITPGRKQWPILEPVRLEIRGPLEPMKWFVLMLLFVLLLTLWFMVVANSNFSSELENDYDPAAGRTIQEHYSGDKGNFIGIFGGICGSVKDG